jgi:hypothetical protein
MLIVNANVTLDRIAAALARCEAALERTRSGRERS